MARSGHYARRVMEQDIRFCELDGRRIAYATVGEGPVLLFGGRWVSHLEEEWEDPHARGFFEEIAHPEVGTHLTPAVPFRYASVSRWLRRPAPTLGQHSREVLAELLGLEAAELDALEAARVIGTRPEGV